MLCDHLVDACDGLSILEELIARKVKLLVGAQSHMRQRGWLHLKFKGAALTA